MHGENQDLGLRLIVQDLTRRLQPVHFRHRQVENADVRPFALGHGDRLATGCRFPRNIPSRLLVQQGPHSLADHIMIVGD
jgi:hypothetical protein